MREGGQGGETVGMLLLTLLHRCSMFKDQVRLEVPQHLPDY
jgi:hypothetical protein